jgi:glycosyltransferase involved in cell wall biosynthesis
MTEAETSTASANRPLAVLQVLPRLDSGGVERGTVEVAAALAAAGNLAVVASAGGPMVREIERAGGVHVKLPLASKNPLVIFANIRRLVEVIHRHNIDIVHARSRAPAWSARAAARRTGKHFVTTFHNAYDAKARLKRRYNAVMATGERVIAISEFVAAHVVSVYGVAREHIRVVHRGVDLKRFDPQRVTAERIVKLATSWRLPDGVPVVMLPGRLSRWKGHLVLIEAMKLLGRPQIYCLFVGSGSPRYQAAIASACARTQDSGTFRLLGECRDMPAAYMLADVIVAPSTEPEGFGRVVVEAQAMGRPVIATAHGGALETVVDGKTGWLVPPGDAPALAAAIARALDLAPEERRDLAARTIAHVRANFTVDAMAARTLAVYDELRGAPRSQPAAKRKNNKKKARVPA